MFVEKKLEFTGTSGMIYTFEVYPRSGQLPNTGGIYILFYGHPRGHLAGFQVEILRIGVADNLNLAITDLRQDDCLLKECWNYTCIMCLDTVATRLDCLEDLRATKSIQC